jgi:hypothetical protein
MYQWSDDFQWLTPGWAHLLITALEDDKGFGGGGAKDGYLMQLGFSGRHHVNSLGAFWAPRLKNWFADNYFQDMYRPPENVGDALLATLSPDELHLTKHSLTKQHPGVNTRDSAQLGRRYNVCAHHRVQWEEVSRARRKFRDYVKSLGPGYDKYIKWAEFATIDGPNNVKLVPGDPFANQVSHDNCPVYPTYKSEKDLYEPMPELDEPWRSA